VVVGELSRKAEQDKDSHVREHLANLLRDILLYDLMPHSDLARKLSDEISMSQAMPETLAVEQRVHQRDGRMLPGS